MRSQQGFTLLELLLVIAVLAAMSVAGIAAYQQRIMNFKVEKTALQMQQILQASQAFYMDRNCPLPPPSTQKTYCWPSKETDLVPYLSGTPLESCPWMGADPDNPCYMIKNKPDDNSFQLAVTIPAGLSNAKDLASMVAARLPNASAATVAPYTVTATVSKTATPPTPAGQMGIIDVRSFLGGQILDLSQAICPSNTTRILYLSLGRITNGDMEGQGNDYVLRYVQFGTPDNPVNPSDASANPEVVSPPDHYQTGVYMHGGGRTGGAFPSQHSWGVAMVACKPTNQLAADELAQSEKTKSAQTEHTNNNLKLFF